MFEQIELVAQIEVVAQIEAAAASQIAVLGQIAARSVDFEGFAVVASRFEAALDPDLGQEFGRLPDSEPAASPIVDFAIWHQEHLKWWASPF